MGLLIIKMPNHRVENLPDPQIDYLANSILASKSRGIITVSTKLATENK